MTSLAQQDRRQLGGRTSILWRQKRDHVRLDRLLHELSSTSPGTEQDRVLGRVARLVFPHAFAEESVLWPLARRVLPDGDALTLEVEREHQEVNDLWSALEQVEFAAPERQAVVQRLCTVLREDVRDEEDRLLPALQERVQVARLRAVGIAWEVVRRTAPTRPHPVVARRPPGNVLAAVPLTLLDRTRDGLDVVALRFEGVRGPLSRASRGLGAVAARVELWDPLRRGERPETRRPALVSPTAPHRV